MHILMALLLLALKDYQERHPEVTVLDPPDAIQHLHNRQSMLQDVADMNLFDAFGEVGVPKQLVITKESLSILDAVSKAGLSLPLELPPGPLLEKLARELRHRLGLCLFNIDMIREHGTKDLHCMYLQIDSLQLVLNIILLV